MKRIVDKQHRNEYINCSYIYIYITLEVRDLFGKMLLEVDPMKRNVRRLRWCQTQKVELDF